jgi:hypothetical protein
MKTIFANATRGGKYEIRLQVTGPDDVFPGTYQIREFVNDREQHFSNLGQITVFAAVAEYNRRIKDAARYDSIFYVRDLRALLSEVL